MSETIQAGGVEDFAERAMPLPAEARSQPGRPEVPLRPGGVQVALKPWIAERARLLHRVCGLVDRDCAAGLKTAQVFRRRARLVRGRKYRCDPGRRVQLTADRLRNVYYQWRHAGRRIEFFQQAYARLFLPVPAAAVRQFVEACAMPDVLSASEAARRVEGGRFTYRRLLDALPARLQQRIWAVLAQRRAARAEARAAEQKHRVAQRRERRHRLHAEAARARALLALAAKTQSPHP
ncbi:MAG TPA: hypothetical protein P5038_13480 [Candidatus Paceibacterota bacterium]|nr:hypothetical protein [Candidatus Paceibacterota bacterium]